MFHSNLGGRVVLDGVRFSYSFSSFTKVYEWVCDRELRRWRGNFFFLSFGKWRLHLGRALFCRTLRTWAGILMYFCRRLLRVLNLNFIFVILLPLFEDVLLETHPILISFDWIKICPLYPDTASVTEIGGERGGVNDVGQPPPPVIRWSRKFW